MDKILADIAEFVNKCLGPLGADGFTANTIRDLFIQLIATIILFIIVRKFLWKPITDFLEARRNMIDNELSKAKTASDNALALEAKLESDFANSKLEIQNLLAQAVKDGNVIKEEIVNQAKAEAARRLDNANKEIEFEIKKQQGNIKDEIISIAFLAAEKIVAKEVDKKKYLSVVTDLIESGLSND